MPIDKYLVMKVEHAHSVDPRLCMRPGHSSPQGIDELYRDNSDQPVKFSLEQDLPEKACQDLLLEFMPEHISKTKITQRLFIK